MVKINASTRVLVQQRRKPDSAKKPFRPGNEAETALILAARSGCPAAENNLSRLVQDLTTQSIRGLGQLPQCRRDAILSDVMTNFWLYGIARGSFQSDAKLGAFIETLTRNAYKKIMNPSKVIKNSKSLFRSDSETGVATDTGLISIESNDASPEEQAARAELNQALKKIFSDPGFLLGVAQGWDGLTQAQQNVVVRDWAGDSNRQGAAALGIKVENYKMQLFRARESLRLACQQALLFGCARQVQEIIPRLKRQF